MGINLAFQRCHEAWGRALSTGCGQLEHGLCKALTVGPQASQAPLEPGQLETKGLNQISSIDLSCSNSKSYLPPPPPAGAENHLSQNQSWLELGSEKASQRSSRNDWWIWVSLSSQKTWNQIPPLALLTYVTLEKSARLGRPQFPDAENG